MNLIVSIGGRSMLVVRYRLMFRLLPLEDTRALASEKGNLNAKIFNP